jgi:hypothetical protein
MVANCFGCLELFVKIGSTEEKGKKKLLPEFEEILQDYGFFLELLHTNKCPAATA